MDEFQGYDQSHEDFMSTCVRCRKTTDAATPRDTKKKERLGHLPRRGSCYSTDVQFVYDHDYRHLATGVLVPHGVYGLHHLRCRRCQRRAFVALQGRPGGAEPTVRAASAGGPLPAVHLQAASDRAPFVLSCRASLKRCHPRFAPDRPGSGTAHPHPNRLHGHATPARYPLRAGTKCSETFLDINDKFILFKTC